MDRRKFQEICEKSRFKLLDPVERDFGYILLAERFNMHTDENPFPHYETLWAIERDGIDTGRTVRNFPYILQSIRVREAVEDAEAWATACLEVGRYKINGRGIGHAG